jgi:hypothetical protein
LNSFYNRRVLILEVKGYEKGNMEYFSKMKKEFLDNLQELRSYYYKYKYIDNLALIRPITEEELVLVELNKTPIDMFIDEMKMKADKMSETRLLSYQFQIFLNYCKENKYKDTSKKYFSAQLKKRGFNVKQLGKKNLSYITGNIKNNNENDENIMLDDSDEDDIDEDTL